MLKIVFKNLIEYVDVSNILLTFINIGDWNQIIIRLRTMLGNTIEIISEIA